MPRPPGVAYVYAPDHKAEQPIAHLAGFKVTLQVDGFAGGRVLAAGGPAPIASEALKRIAQLYAIEGDIRGSGAGDRREARLRRRRPIIDGLEPWLGAKLALIVRRQNSLKQSAMRSRVGRG